MIPHSAHFVPERPGSWVKAASFAIAALLPIAPRAAHAEDARSAGQAQVRDYRPVFLECHRAGTKPRLAIRRMEIDGTATLLTVDSATLATSLEREQGWFCADTDDERQEATRYMRAVRSSSAPQAGSAAPSQAVIVNGGLGRGATTGSFITGDLCPSRKPLDRKFLENLQAAHAPMQIALSISGTWLTRHEADFEWLREQQRSGALKITWVDHSYHHPYVAGRPLADNFLLMQGVDMQAEVLDTERLLIAHGETPSVFFRFPGLISSRALMQAVRDDHLIVLGADAWLAKSPRARPGDIILVHPNGNEPAGLEIFSTLLAAGKLPQPFRPIGEAP